MNDEILRPYYVWRIEDGESHCVVSQQSDGALRYMAKEMELTLDQYVEEFSPKIEQLPPKEVIEVRLESWGMPDVAKLFPIGTQFVAKVTPLQFLKNGPEQLLASTMY